MRILYSFLFILLFLQSCGTIGKAAKATSAVEEQKLSAFKTQYLNNSPNFQHLQAKAKLSADIDGKSKSATLRLYFDQDKMIWANVSLLGITGARAKITPDKVQAYEILEKTYVDDNFSYINERFKVDFIDFQKFNQLLLGQLFLIDSWQSYDLRITDENEYALEYKKNKKLQRNPVENEYIHTFFLDSDYKLKRAEILDSKSNTQITVDYSNWLLVDGNKLPGVVKIMIKGKDSDIIQIDYNNFDFSEMNPPFRIPKNYKERKLK